MKSETIRQVLNSTKPPLNFYSSDGQIVYVDHPELVFVTEPLIIVVKSRSHYSHRTDKTEIHVSRRLVFHTTKSRVRQPRVRRRLHPRAGAITSAIQFAAKIGTTARHTFRQPWFVWIKAVARPAWILHRTLRVIIGPIPIRAPFPHIPRHVMKAKIVRWITSNG